MIGSGVRSIGKAQKRTHDVARYPAPVGGMNVTQAIGEANLNTCIYTYNMMPFEYGLRVRQGYREWQLAVASGEGIHTLIPFTSASTSGVGSKLFAVNNFGIWDVTVAEATPALVVTFGNQDADAGYGTFTSYIDTAENDILFYADNLNGLYSYNADTDTWTNTGIFTGTILITEADVTSVMAFKNRVWFTAKDSTVGYYLPLLSSTGELTAQYFGDKFKHGGVLTGLFSWTVDSGDGLDEILVAASKAGDVLVYTGSGPTEADWGLKGSYFIGAIPNTPRFGSEQGGELYLLSTFGLTSMNDLLQGVDTAAIQANIEGTSITSKIAGLLRRDMETKRELRGWDVATIPAEGGILISTPTIGSEAPIQYYYNLGTGGWGLWRDVPMTCFVEYSDSVYFGDATGRTLIMDVTVDNELITAPTPPLVNGDDISFSILTAFTPFDSPGIYKGVKLIRPDFISSHPTGYSSQARYDFDMTEGLLQSLTDPIANQPFAKWDITNWDEAIWGAEDGIPLLFIGGSWGTGRYVAIATKGTCRTRTRLIGWDVIYTAGGPMI